MHGFNDPVARLAESLSEPTDPAARQQAFMRCTTDFGVSCFVYAHLTPLEQLRHIETNYPSAWMEHYLKQNHHKVDCVFLHALRSPSPFRWRDALALPQYASSQIVFDEAAAFGIHDGYCVPIRDPNGLAMMSMAVNDPAVFDPAAPHRLYALHLMSVHFHLACERSLAVGASQNIRLTEREREVLCWTAQGKTGWEIAQILNLTERTITFHVENAKVKLGASSRGHAAIKALSLGLISL